MMPNRAWFLSLPYISCPNQGLLSSLNPYEWQGPNGWSDTNAQSFVVCATNEDDARRYAAEVDCDIWKDTRYAPCVPFATCFPDWKEGVICVEWGGAANE